MIKINLATKKQSQAASPESKSAGLSMPKLDAGAFGELLKTPKIRQLALFVVAGFALSFVLQSYKQEELNKLDVEMQRLTGEQGKLKAEVAKTAGYEQIKKTLEEDELAIRTKIDTIQKLLADRSNLPRMMLNMSQVIPKEVWLTEFRVQSDDVSMKGYSLGYNQISDFMKNLSESAYLSDLKLGSTQASRDETGSEVAQFELDAKKRQ